MKQTLLRYLLLVDSAVLLLLGALLILAPARVLAAFHFQALPQGLNYLVVLWGCAMATLSIGYYVASTNPSRHVVWIQVAIARSALEALLGVIYLAQGIVTFQQAGLGIVIAALIALAYITLYPRASES
jgi:hypothetical protein